MENTTYKRSPMMQARLEKNRQEIIQAARKLISNDGFKGAQISSIAETAGVSTGLIYRYFSSKSQLMVEILTDAVMHEIQLIDNIAQRESHSPTENLEAAIQSFVSRALTGSKLAYAFITEPVDTLVEAERIRCRRLFANAILKILQQGIEQQVFDLDIENVDIAATCIIGAMTEAVINPITATENLTIHKNKIIHTIIHFCLYGIVKTKEK